MPDVLSSVELLATLCCGLFAGAAVYINLVEHPARMECGTQLAATEFGPSYRRAAMMQVALAAGGLVAAILAWLAGADRRWLLGGLLLGAVVPYTLIVIMPTNRKLLGSGLDRSSPKTRELLIRWGRLHAVRSALSLAAFALFLYLLAAGMR